MSHTFHSGRIKPMTLWAAILALLSNDRGSVTVLATTVQTLQVHHYHHMLVAHSSGRAWCREQCEQKTLPIGKGASCKFGRKTDLAEGSINMFKCQTSKKALLTLWSHYPATTTPKHAMLNENKPPFSTKTSTNPLHLQALFQLSHFLWVLIVLHTGKDIVNKQLQCSSFSLFEYRSIWMFLSKLLMSVKINLSYSHQYTSIVNVI